MGREIDIARRQTARTTGNVVRNASFRVVGTAAQKIRSIFRSLRRDGISKALPFSVGHVEKRMRDFANANGIAIANGDLYMSVKGITHARRPSKIRDGLAVSESDMAEFPKKRSQMDLFHDGTSFIYTDYKNKFIIHPNYELKIDGKKKKKV